jgi:hypothetical protein
VGVIGECSGCDCAEMCEEAGDKGGDECGGGAEPGFVHVGEGDTRRSERLDLGERIQGAGEVQRGELDIQILYMGFSDIEKETHLCPLRVEVISTLDGNVESLCKTGLDSFATFDFGCKLNCVLQRNMHELVFALAVSSCIDIDASNLHDLRGTYLSGEASTTTPFAKLASYFQVEFKN